MNDEAGGQFDEEIFRSILAADISPLNDLKLTKEFEAEDHRQRHGFRRCMFWIVSGLMVFEVAAMFVIVLLQGFGGVPFLKHDCDVPFQVERWNFKLDQWVLASFEAGVLVQTFFLARIITSSLFTKND